MHVSNQHFHAIIFQFHLCEYIEMKLLFWDPFFSGTVDDIIFIITANNHRGDDVNTILCTAIVRLKISPDTSFNHVASLVYKWLGCRHHIMNIPHIHSWKDLASTSCLKCVQEYSSIQETYKMAILINFSHTSNLSKDHLPMLLTTSTIFSSSSGQISGQCVKPK